MKISPIVRIMRTEDCAPTLPISEYHSLGQETGPQAARG